MGILHNSPGLGETQATDKVSVTATISGATATSIIFDVEVEQAP